MDIHTILHIFPRRPISSIFWGKSTMWQQAPSHFFACSSLVDTFLDLQRFSSEASPVILVNRSWALHFFDKGFNIDFVSSLFIQNAYVSVLIKLIRARGYTHLEEFILIACSKTDGFGYLFCPGANSYGLSSSFCVIFVSFLAAFAIKLISGGNKKIFLIASGNGFQLFP